MPGRGEFVREFVEEIEEVRKKRKRLGGDRNYIEIYLWLIERLASLRRGGSKQRGRYFES